MDDADGLAGGADVGEGDHVAEQDGAHLKLPWGHRDPENQSENQSEHSGGANLKLSSRHRTSQRTSQSTVVVPTSNSL